MPHGPPHFQETAIPPPVEVPKSTAQLKCEADGGRWDLASGTCILPKLDIKQVGIAAGLGAEKKPLTKIDPATVPKGANIVTDRFGNERIQTPADVAEFGGESARHALERKEQQQREGQGLAGQVGQFDPLAVAPTDISQTEALTTGIVGSIPRALALAVTAGGAAFVTGGAVTGGIGAVPAGIIGAAAGFIAGITGGMISNFKSQRSDTTTAQQRVLDEGKQTLMDWVTLARADPSKRMEYLARFNQQLALINHAFRQMKLDTSRDLAKFETAVPNLAEFNTFYSVGGERDALIQEMRNALLAQAPEGYDMLELSHRRKAL